MITNLKKRITHANNVHCFTNKMAAKTSWHRKETKLRHCLAMYTMAQMQSKISRPWLVWESVCRERCLVWTLRCWNDAGKTPAALPTACCWNHRGSTGNETWCHRCMDNRKMASGSTSHGRVSVCLSDVRVLSKRLNESSWVLAWELPSTRPIVLTGNSAISKIKGTSLWNCVKNSGLTKFCFGCRSSKRVINLTGERWTLWAWSTGQSSVNSVDNSSVLRRSSTSLSQWSSSSVYNTVRSRGSISDSWYLYRLAVIGATLLWTLKPLCGPDQTAGPVTDRIYRIASYIVNTIERLRKTIGAGIKVFCRIRRHNIKFICILKRKFQQMPSAGHRSTFIKQKAMTKTGIWYKSAVLTRR